MNVCEALLDILCDYGVKYIFGIPGDSINSLLEAIRKQNKIKFIHVVHEESGAFAASAQAKLGDGLGVCVGTSGPGAIHLLNGLYDAKMDHAPVLAITGQIETALLGTGYQQEVNLISLFEDVSVFNESIVNPKQMPELAILACQTALSENGVAHINIPRNIATKEVVDFINKKKIIKTKNNSRPEKSEIKAAATLINNSYKPCILAGIGARKAVKEVVELAEVRQAPIIKALRGKDILPDSHHLALGGIGLLGTVPSLKAIQNCDLLIVIGSDFPYPDFYPDAQIPVIQIDHDISHLGRRHPVSNPLCGEARLVLLELLPSISVNHNTSFLKNCQKNKLEWDQEQTAVESSGKSPIRPQSLAMNIGHLSSNSAIVCCDTGAVTVWGARHFKIKQEQRFILSGNLASMGFALPAAIGAQLLHPKNQVIALCGDGGFAMLMCDFATAVKYNLPVKIFIFNNSKLGLIQMEQEAFEGNPEYETKLLNPDYAEYAKICGGEGYTIREPFEMVSVIQLALTSQRPCIVNVFVNPEEITWPPKITSNDIVHYLKAKVKEYFSGH